MCDDSKDQKPYTKARRRCAFHVKLPNSDTDKIMLASRLIIFNFNLNGPAEICGPFTENAMRCFKAGVDIFVGAAYKFWPALC